MKVVLQRVGRASVSVEGLTVAQIERGLLLLVGVADGDSEEQADWLALKISGLRVFEDEAGKMNLSVLDVGGEVLCVSQFTLLADTSRGKRPSFAPAAKPEVAEPLFDRFCTRLLEHGAPVRKGVFGATMEVALVNDGPVTLTLERR
ncbi:D-aminoacyl-tRNA deacylase [Rubrobacter indicoceani]|uniref:D-aminoacyl-tRNA deacylase n=1 Tax=Rubrobacter indicoceani TaxID=2051957 RepID=UPI000E5A691E|nr:D-aminoacyl-tRNA deacylase [Rubrobacter indicoceani]